MVVFFLIISPFVLFAWAPPPLLLPWLPVGPLTGARSDVFFASALRCCCIPPTAPETVARAQGTVLASKKKSFMPVNDTPQRHFSAFLNTTHVLSLYHWLFMTYLFVLLLLLFIFFDIY